MPTRGKISSPISHCISQTACHNAPTIPKTGPFHKTCHKCPSPTVVRDALSAHQDPAILTTHLLLADTCPLGAKGLEP